MNKGRIALICGLMGCLCYGAGDWLMLYGDPAHAGRLLWLTAGAAAIPQARYNAAMALAFPGTILYGIALFSVQRYIPAEKNRRVYRWLNAFGLTPWMALHLFYIMLLSLFSWLNANGYAAEAPAVCEGLYARLAWLVPACEGFMLPVFLYWFCLQLGGRTLFPRWAALTNVLFILAALKGAAMLMPVSAFRLAFTNALMSESMALWFGILLAWEIRGIVPDGEMIHDGHDIRTEGRV